MVLILKSKEQRPLLLVCFDLPRFRPQYRSNLYSTACINPLHSFPISLTLIETPKGPTIRVVDDHPNDSPSDDEAAEARDRLDKQQQSEMVCLR